MATTSRLGTGFKGPLVGSGRALGGLARDLPIDVVTNRHFCFWFNDFLTVDDYESATDQPWVQDDIGVPAVASVTHAADELGGVLLVDAGTTSSTGIQTQFTGTAGAGEFLALNDNAMDGKVFAWEARFKVDTVANGSALIGMLETDATALSTAGAVTVDNGLYILMADGGAVTASAERATAVTASTATITMANDTYIRIGMRCFAADVSVATSAQTVGVYVNDNLVDTLGDATNGVIPNVGLCPTFAAVNDAANDIDLRIDYFWVAIER